MVLDYEQREEAEELKGSFFRITNDVHMLTRSIALEARNRAGAVKIRYIG